MNKIIKMSLLLMLGLGLWGCSNDVTTTLETYTVSFVSNGGNLILDQEVAPGQTVEEPSSPIKSDYVFDAWYVDAGLENLYDFSDSVNQDMTLYAGWIEEPGLKIGVILPTEYEERWVDAAGYFDDELASLGEGYFYEILFSNESRALEYDHFEYLINEGVEVIIVTSFYTNEAALELADEAGVTVIAHDVFISPMELSEPDYLTMFNAWDIGKAQGDYLVEQAAANGCSESHPCDLALFSGHVDNYPISTHFFGGAMEVIQPNLGMFNLINVDPYIAASLGFYTLDTYDMTAKSELEALMADGDTRWDTSLSYQMIYDILNSISDDKSNEDLYILSPADFISLSMIDAIDQSSKDIGDVYASYYITGQDVFYDMIYQTFHEQYLDLDIHSMSVLKSQNKLVEYSVSIAKNIVDGNDPLIDVSYVFEDGYYKVFVPVDVIRSDQLQDAYDLLFGSGLYDKTEFDIDFSEYE